MSRILLGLAILLSLVTSHSAQSGPPPRDPGTIQSMDVCGDSISKAFNGSGSSPCSNREQEQFNWATSDTHGDSWCSAGPDGVYSHAERIECLKSENIVSITPNSAMNGAQMLKDFVDQSTAVYGNLIGQPAPRYVPVLMGHNDVCSGTVWKYLWACGSGTDQDRNNYCRTAPGAFERELRKGLDILMSLPDTHIGVASMVRVSQLCNHGAKRNCQTFTSCQNVWSAAAFTGWIFGQANGICGSLTSSCSDTRIRDAYRTAKMYRDILMRVTGQYAAIPPGGDSPVVFVGGETVGGQFKADGVTIAFSDALWRYRFSSSDIGCCDCYHPSAAGQNATSDMLFNGLRCTPERPCCVDTGDPVLDGRCAVTTTGAFYPGLF